MFPVRGCAPLVLLHCMVRVVLLFLSFMQLAKLGLSNFHSVVKKDLETIVNTLSEQYIQPAMTAFYSRYTQTLPDFVNWLRTRLRGWALGRGTLPHGWPWTSVIFSEGTLAETRSLNLSKESFSMCWVSLSIENSGLFLSIFFLFSMNKSHALSSFFARLFLFGPV